MAEARCKVPPTFEVVSEHPRQSAPGAATSRYRPDPWYGFGTVGRTCIVCRHADRRTVDAAIASGTPYRRIAAQYGLKAAAVGRHAKAHLPQEAAAGGALLERVLDLERGPASTVYVAVL